MMTDYEIERYLEKKNITPNSNIFQKIKDRKENAIKENDESKANYYWFLEEIYKIQNYYCNAFIDLVKHDYEEAWRKFDYADIGVSYLESNVFIADYARRFHIDFISNMIFEYQKLFPYKLFFSRESVIKSEECNICGKKISLRHSCGHIPGKVYMGKLCLRIVTDLDLKAIALVKDPFDKYALLKVEGVEYNYQALEELLKNITSPFEKFHVNIEKRIKPEYKKIGRNDLCPCGSGKKYKKCHWGTEDELMEHYVICLSKN